VKTIDNFKKEKITKVMNQIVFRLSSLLAIISPFMCLIATAQPAKK
jgi:hypothetical protein